MKRNHISIRQLRLMIREEADVIINIDSVEELEPREDAWSGGENLTLSIDHSEAGGSENVVSSPETLSIVDDRGVYRMSETRLRRIVRQLLRTT